MGQVEAAQQDHRGQRHDRDAGGEAQDRSHEGQGNEGEHRENESLAPGRRRSDRAPEATRKRPRRPARQDADVRSHQHFSCHELPYATVTHE